MKSEGNDIYSIDRETFSSLINLKEVCFKDNPLNALNSDINKVFCQSRTDCVVRNDGSCCELQELNINGIIKEYKQCFYD